MDKVTLWTRQDKRILEAIQSTGVYKVKAEYVKNKYGDMFNILGEIYSWLVFESSNLVKKPEGADYPIWCSVSDELMLRGTKDTVILKLSIDKDKVIFFDTNKWGYAINNMYIPLDEKDEKAFMEKLKSRGLNPDYPILDEDIKRFYPDIKRDIINSRNRIFNIGDTSFLDLQANIWEIRKEDIVSIEHWSETNQA